MVTWIYGCKERKKVKANEIVCKYHDIIIHASREIMYNQIDVKKHDLRFIAEAHGFDVNLISYTPSYFKERFQGKTLEFILKTLQSIGDAEKEFNDLYDSIKNIVREEKGYSID